MRPFIIAIDGPSGAGKGTVARAVARALGLRHVDTGAMYRAVAWMALQSQIPLDDERAVAAMAAHSTFQIGPRVAIDRHDVTQAIRTPAIDAASAQVARLPAVREVLVARQREMSGGGGLVMEGRDIGTVVFPDADVKVYLDASPDERARRRAHDPAHAGATGGVADVASALDERDRSDRTRAASPLATAADALVIDTTGVPVEEVVARVLALARARQAARGREPG
jgi:cytidylate kinase